MFPRPLKKSTSLRIEPAATDWTRWPASGRHSRCIATLCTLAFIHRTQGHIPSNYLFPSRVLVNLCVAYHPPATARLTEPMPGQQHHTTKSPNSTCPYFVRHIDQPPAVPNQVTIYPIFSDKMLKKCFVTQGRICLL